MEERTKILIVDDTPGNRRLYAAMLGGMDLDIDTAASGLDAIAACEQNEYAMVLLDVSMPGMDGFETAARLRTQVARAPVPIVLVSAIYTRQGHALHGYELGAVDYLFAPVDTEALRAKAAMFVSLQRLRRQAEEQAARLAEANRALHDLNDELEAFSYSAAHDLKAPLRAISGFSGMLREDHAAQLDEEGKAYLQRIGTAAERMGRLIDDTLTLARVTRGELHRTEVDLSALAGEIAAQLAASAPERRADWTIAPGLKANGDAGMLLILLTNLLDNAWKYSAKKTRAKIEFGAAPGDGATEFFVRDNGAGFDMKSAEGKLFQPFQRLHGTEEFPGTGVGLATAERVVRKHGGRIRAEAEKGKGAAFYFTLG